MWRRYVYCPNFLVQNNTQNSAFQVKLDVTTAESKATYQQIKDWVQKECGLTVSSLNIAQVKRANGIIERECYNETKSEDSRQPGCPEEKWKAIEEALKYFQMI